MWWVKLKKKKNQRSNALGTLKKQRSNNSNEIWAKKEKDNHYSKDPNQALALGETNLHNLLPKPSDTF